MSIDELRGLVGDGDEKEESIPANVRRTDEARERRRKQRRFLGLSARQRAFLAVLIFLIVVINGFALLAITGRIG